VTDACVLVDVTLRNKNNKDVDLDYPSYITDYYLQTNSLGPSETLDSSFYNALIAADGTVISDTVVPDDIAELMKAFHIKKSKKNSPDASNRKSSKSKKNSPDASNRKSSKNKTPDVIEISSNGNSSKKKKTPEMIEISD
jgi:hypothetical protein